MLHRRAGTPSARRPPPWRRRRPAPRGCARRQNPTPLFVPMHNTAGTYGNVPLTMEYVSGHLQRKSTMPQNQAQDQSNAAQAAKPADEPAPSMTAPAARPVPSCWVPVHPPAWRLGPRSTDPVPDSVASWISFADVLIRIPSSRVRCRRFLRCCAWARKAASGFVVAHNRAAQAGGGATVADVGRTVFPRGGAAWPADNGL